jgi:hypothetical protein
VAATGAYTVDTAREAMLDELEQLSSGRKISHPSTGSSRAISKRPTPQELADSEGARALKRLNQRIEQISRGEKVPQQ